MDIVLQKLQPISRFLDRIQRFLSLELLEHHPQFDQPTKPGKVSLVGCTLGTIWGIHMTMLLGISVLLSVWRRHDILDRDADAALSNETDNLLPVETVPVRLWMAWTWCFYIVSLCTFHLLEFFVTAFYNPLEASSDSFLINHSKAYTAAILLAACEFWIRFLFFPYLPNRGVLLVGILLVFLSQTIRSTAMKTCGESFNHFIQTSKKDNHKLVTNGIYRFLRHPSYVGFFYYSIGTQVVLHNCICTVVFALAGWSFFSRRIPYEERSLIHHFGDEYLEYANRTHVGIPFISKKGLVPEEETDQDSDRNEEGVEQTLTLEQDDNDDGCGGVDNDDDVVIVAGDLVHSHGSGGKKTN
ncbi:isoprenylcysteine carboxyl methyltransferase [Nitzschia inconspicua]|uniref:Protein-S-isoprenylcysteine O-methyltransferase n=1 Tax=Nitzschia inconspicua TaxID=303405 RepID=A0A9K3L2Y5_9STRA|nr:isoprenylcysteine carboxyl methyltransferase [Nitzschia inconspicua]